MIVDGELGMPLELGQIAPGSYGDGSYWTGTRTGAFGGLAPWELACSSTNGSVNRLLIYRHRTTTWLWTAGTRR